MGATTGAFGPRENSDARRVGAKAAPIGRDDS
jgi:hypothetical protein